MATWRRAPMSRATKPGPSWTAGPSSLDPPRPAAAERMDGAGPGGDPSGDGRPTRDVVLLPPVQPDLLPVDDQDIGAFDDEAVLVEVVHVLGRDRVGLRPPEGHLAAVGAIEDVALDTAGVLGCGGDAVRRVLHERGV